MTDRELALQARQRLAASVTRMLATLPMTFDLEDVLRGTRALGVQDDVVAGLDCPKSRR